MPQVKKGDASSLRQLINRVKSHECTSSIVFECTCSRFNVKSFNGSYSGRDTPTMGANHHYSYEFTNHSRVEHIPGCEVQDLGINPEYTVNEDNHCQSTSTSVCWK
jgi:hypothetical protein